MCVDFQLAEAEEFVFGIGKEEKGSEFDWFTIVTGRVGVLGWEFAGYKAKSAAEFDGFSVGAVCQKPGGIRTNDGGESFSVDDFDFGGLPQGDGEVFGIDGCLRLGFGRVLLARAFWGRAFSEEELAEAVEFAVGPVETRFESPQMSDYGRPPVVGRKASFFQFAFEMVEMVTEPLAALIGVD